MNSVRNAKADQTVEQPENASQPVWKERVGIWCLGVLGNKAIDWGFDYALYPVVIWYFGIVFGAVVMTIASCLACLATLKFYDWSRQDWLGIETLKELPDPNSHNWLRRIAARLLQKGDWAALIVLSIQFDPFITTAFMRHGAFQFNGMSSRDWRIFLLSTVVSNGWWSFMVFGGLSIFSSLWRSLGY